MTKEEWLTEFQVFNGRLPSEEELEKAESQSYPAIQLANKRFRLDFWFIIKIAVLLLVAIFGYIVGYLFT